MKGFFKKSRLLILLAALLVVSMLPSCAFFGDTEKYSEANKLFDEGKYAEALLLYTELGSYKDSEARALVASGIADMENGEFKNTVKAVLELGVAVTISYDVNGGLLEDQKGDKTSFTFTKPTEFRDVKLAEKTDCEFLKWDITKCAFTDNGWDLSLKAIFSSAEYDIAYELDGGEIADGEDFYHADSEKTLATPIKTGYTFLGWTGEGIEEPMLNVVIPQGSSGEKSFTAHWSANSYEITLVADGAELLESQFDFVYGDAYILPDVSKFGYILDGWYANGSEIPKSGIWEIAEDVTLTAKWEEKLFISFIGDSVSTYENYTNNGDYNENLSVNNVFYTSANSSITGLESVMDTYWMLAVEELGLELCVPNACGASRVTDTVGDVYPDQIIPSGPERAGDLHRMVDGVRYDPDIIFAFLGANDLGYSFPDSNDPTRYNPISVEDFRAAYNSFIELLKTNYPDAKIYVATIHPLKHNAREIPEENYIAFNNVIRSAAQSHDLGLVDIAEDSGITWDNFESYTCDSIHFNNLGMQKMAECLIRAINEDFNLK